MGGGEVFVCRLKEDNSNLYLDGSQANLTGPEGDVMVVFLEFWYKWYKVDDNRFLYHFADHDIDGTYIHVPESLVGAYKGYVSLNRLYSWSDVTPTTNVSLSDFRSYAKARGTGYQVIDFQQHCVIAMMLYAKYKTRIRTRWRNLLSGYNNGKQQRNRWCGYRKRILKVRPWLRTSGAGKYASSQDLAYGSRPTFRGTISEVSPEQFKKLPAL